MPTVSFNTNFPGYDVLGEIGRSNARVLKARHLDSGDLVAIKHFALNTDADTLRRFKRESEIMTRITHPNIVRVREVQLEADLPYIVLDYIEGGNVRQLLKEQGGLSVELVIRLGLQVINAFRLIHAQGIIHRDVKPENILYHRLASGELHFLLTDFGVARLHEQPLTMTGQSLMTYEYAAPEQFDNPRNVSESVDYYGLGVVLYECLTGHVPFAMRNETGIITFMNAVLSMPPPPPVLASRQPIPPTLTHLIDQLLLKNPAERLHQADGVRLALKQAEVEQLHYENNPQDPLPDSTSLPFAASASQTITQPTPDPARLRAEQVASRRRRGWLPVVVVVGLLLLGSGGVYWFMQHRPAPTPAVIPPADTLITPPIAEPIPAVVTPTVVTPADTHTVQPKTQEEEVPIPEDTVGQPVAQLVETPSKKLTPAARRQYNEQVAEAMKHLEAETFGGKSRLLGLGGISGLSVQLRNLSTVTFIQVAVRVKYFRDNGDLYKSTVMYFNQIKPNDTIVRTAPDSPHGTRFTAEVARADAAPPDSPSTTQTP